VRRICLAVAVALVAFALAAPAQAGKGKRPSGIEGKVTNSTCAGPCIYPPPPAPTYTGDGLTVQVRRVSDGELMATLTPADGTFRVKVKRGLYDVSASVAQPTPQPQPTPQAAPGACWSGDTERVRVFRHRFTHVELQVGNVCIV
jgi:hypothetical protein